MAADAGIYPSSVIDLFAGAAAAPATCISWINSIDLTLDGKPVDITSFNCGTPPTWTATKQTIKSFKCSLKGWLDFADAGQLVLAGEYNTPTAATIGVKITFGPAGTYSIISPITVDSIGIAEKADGLQEVTYELSGAGNATLDLTA